ncbi:hypothetical protein P3G55_20690 [Leptospira sp. 96542]|nr:hypothetical protein [Leptospira sp. 96542]
MNFSLKGIPTPYLIAGGVALGLIAYTTIRGAKGVGQDVGKAAVDLVDGVVSGSVTQAGQIVGIPKTDMSECERAKAEGRTWDASFACSAGDFISWLAGGK